MSAEPRPKHSRAYRLSGFHGMQAALTKRGISALDGRSASARHVARWKADVTADLGGDLSTAKRTLLEVAAMDVALLAVADSWLREHAAGVINRKRKTFVPLVTERLRVAAHLADVLKLLGLERRAKVVGTLDDRLLEVQARRDAQDARAEVPVGDPVPDDASVPQAVEDEPQEAVPGELAGLADLDLEELD